MIEEGIFKGLDESNLEEKRKPYFDYESHHKTNIKTIFNNLQEADRQQNPFLQQQNDWRENQLHLEEEIGRELADNTFIDVKVRNDVYVANIMNNHDMMREAANFCLAMSKMYGENGDEKRKAQIKKSSGEMDHMWPNQDLGKSLNKDYRGHTSVAKSIGSRVLNQFGIKKYKDDDYLSKALSKNIPTLNNLVDKDRYNLEETMYILRAMGQLRDVMKAEKKKNGLVRNYIDENRDGTVKDRINVDGKENTADRNNPKEHKESRRYYNRYVQSLGSYMTQEYGIYAVQNRMEGEPQKFDYLQGTSGTTLDMINFFRAHDYNNEQSSRLMQVFYANWHAVAPDGNAHSQSESIGTMLQYLNDVNLRVPILTPITSEADVTSMTTRVQSVNERTRRRSRYGNSLERQTNGHRGYLRKKGGPRR